MMKRFLSFILALVCAFSTVGVFAANNSNIDSWAKEEIEKDFVIVSVKNNTTVPAQRITLLKAFYMVFEQRGSNEIIENISPPFKDMGHIEPHTVECNAVTWLYALGILKGDDKGYINPKSWITRAEFASLLRRTIDKHIVYNDKSIDISNHYYDDDIKNHWAYNDIIAVSHLGLLQGDGRYFHPDNTITIQEAMLVFLRLCDKIGISRNKVAQILDEVFGIETEIRKPEVRVGETLKLYSPDGSKITGYSVKNGKNNVKISQKIGYLVVEGLKEGKASIEIKYSGKTETITIEVAENQLHYGTTQTLILEEGESTRVYFENLSTLEDYKVSSSNYLNVKLYANYLYVEAREGKTGTVTVTAYDEYGDSEAAKLMVTEAEEEDTIYYGITQNLTLEEGESTRVYFENLSTLEDYKVTRSSFLNVKVYDNYLYVEAKSEKTGTVTVTAYDEYGDSEAAKVMVTEAEEEDTIYYGITQNLTLEEGESAKVYFENLSTLEDYKVTRSSFLNVKVYASYLYIEAKSEKTGTVTVTAYDENGDSEAAKVMVVDEGTTRPERPKVYTAPDNIIDLTK